MRKYRLQTLRVLGSLLAAPVDNRPDNQGNVYLSPEHIVPVSRLISELVHGIMHEIHSRMHQYRAHTGQCRPHGYPRDTASGMVPATIAELPGNPCSLLFGEDIIVQ
ncbi:hypothetical protein ES703_43113 [subsurface metagenome]